MPGDEKPPKPKNGNSGPPTPHAPDKPCCCKSVTLYLDDVCVEEATSGGLPFLGKLRNDHVQFRCYVECKTPPELVAWPENEPGGIEVETGTCKHPNRKLVTLTPNADCRIVCSLRIAVYKRSPSAKILEALTRLLADIANAAVQLEAMKKALPLGQSSSPATDALQAKVDDMFKQAGAAWAALTGVGDELMDEFGINFNGPFGCSDDMFSAFENTSGLTQDPANKNRATISRLVQGHDGRWRLTFSAIKVCP